MNWPARVAATFALGASLAAGLGPAAAQDCPTERTAGDGFIVERGSQSKTEVFRDGRIVRTVLRFGGRTLLETTQFEGLLELDRIDRGQRTSLKPKSDLGKLFPLKAGQRSTVEFELTGASMSAGKRTVELHVIGADELYIGRCKYKVFKIERSQGQADARPVFFDIDYYAPDLKLIVAKEFKEPGGRSNLNKFDKIYPAPR